MSGGRKTVDFALPTPLDGEEFGDYLWRARQATGARDCDVIIGAAAEFYLEVTEATKARLARGPMMVRCDGRRHPELREVRQVLKPFMLPRRRRR